MAGKQVELAQLLGESELAEKITELARRISRDYAGRRPILVAILKGSFIFLADLARKLEIEHEIDFMMVASYDEDPHESGNVKLLMDLSRNISGEDVLIIEDIVDSGKTLNYIYHSLMVRKPKTLEIVALLDKHDCRQADVNIKYIGFEIPDCFVVGYGLDEAELYRGLPYVACRHEKG